MPTVAITDDSFPDPELERSILSADGFELRSGNGKEFPVLQTLVAEADAVITPFAPINGDVKCRRLVHDAFVPADSPLRSLPNVITTSHIASASPKAVRTLRETAAKIAAMALRGASLPNDVNGVVNRSV